ncbi:MAG: HD domain-containing protein [Candidatus Margulisiibacteriota bacterium]|nr:HD domain-containing protein [Candidatus Margulisiibacteriota bacterium]
MTGTSMIPGHTRHLRTIQGLFSARLKQNPLITKLLTAAVQGKRGPIMASIPEFAKMNRAQNNGYHKYNMDMHTFKFISALLDDPAVKGKVNERILLAALLHDIGKPKTETIKENGKSTYLKHDKVGAELAKKIIARLGITEKADQITALIEKHMAPVTIIEKAGNKELTDKALGRFVRKVIEPLEKMGIGLDALLAFGRADLLASQGPDCYQAMGAPDGDYLSLVSRVTSAVDRIKARVKEYHAAQKKNKSGTPQSVSGKDLIQAGLKPGPRFKSILAEAAQLEIQQGLKGPALVNFLVEKYTA